LIVDDEAVAQRIIRKYLSDLPNFEIITTAFNAIEAMQVLQKESIDLMFLDIEMPKIKGLAFLKTLQNPPDVIITTAYRDYALEGFELEVIDYLLKPISFERFLKAINKYQKTRQSIAPPPISVKPTEEQFIYVKSERKTLKLREADIQYLEGMSNYIVIYIDGKSHIVYASITKMLEQLSDQFLRIHKSYVVNKRFIRSYSKEAVEVGEKELPIGKSYKEVIERF